jgi:hypothetical protein
MSIRRTSSAESTESAGSGVAPSRSLATPFGADDTAELLLDLLEHTALVAPDALALVRGRTVQGAALTQALIDEGVASSDGVARMLAVRHHLPVIDLPAVGVAIDAFRTSSKGMCSGSLSPTRGTSTPSTSSDSPRSTPSNSSWPPATTFSPSFSG